MCRKEKKAWKLAGRKETENNFWDTFLHLRDDPRVLELKKYPQHNFSNIYDHSCRVAVCSFDLAKRLHLRVDGESLARGAMLHDYYLYHARGKDVPKRAHWFGHPVTALNNAEKIFELNDKEKNIIFSHMWPLTFLHFPLSKEAFLVGMADKVCAFGEGVFKHTTHKNRKV